MGDIKSVFHDRCVNEQDQTTFGFIIAHKASFKFQNMSSP